MHSLKRQFRIFLQREDGPTTFEYAVMLSLIISVCVSAVTSLGTKTTQPLPTVSNALKAGSS
jgi:pilus assembly protein Flp/PilA